MYLSAAVQNARTWQRREADVEPVVRGSSRTDENAGGAAPEEPSALVHTPGGASYRAVSTDPAPWAARRALPLAVDTRDAAQRAGCVPRRVQVVAGGRGAGGLTGQDGRVRTDASVPLEMLEASAAANRGDGQRSASTKDDRCRASQPITRPLTDPRERQRRRQQHDERAGAHPLVTWRADSSSTDSSDQDEAGGARAAGEDEDDGPDSDEEAVSTGTVISPNTVVCALATTAARDLVRGLHRLVDQGVSSATGDAQSSSQPLSFRLPAVRGDLALTVECGGWLRVRESRTGTVFHQQQLRGGHEATGCVWVVTQTGGAQPCRLWAVCGLLGGQLSFFEVVHNTLHAWPKLAPVTVHTEPVVGLVPLYLVTADTPAMPAGSSELATTPRRHTRLRLFSLLLSMDAGGQLVLWQLDDGGSHGRRGQPPHRRRHGRPQFTCLQYAATDWQSSAVAADGSGEGATEAEDSTWGPAVLASGTTLNPTGFLVSHPLLVEGPDGAADTTAVHLYTCSESFLGSLTDAREAGDAPATRGEPWHQLVRTYAGVDRARDGVVTALCAIRCDADDSGATSDHPHVACGQVWAGTSGGVLCVWEAQTAYWLRRIILPSSAPAHVLSSCGATPCEVWACQLDGAVTAWHTRTFQLNQALPLSYPPMHTQPKQQGSLHSETAVRVRDAADLAWALCGDPSLAPTGRPTGAQRKAWLGGARQHFTLAITGLESVSFRRAWSTATDGSVRTWLVPDGVGHQTAHPSTAAATLPTGSEAASPLERDEAREAAPPPLDHREVRAFLFAIADTMAAAQADHDAELAAQAEHIRKLEARNRILAEALRRAAETEMSKLSESVATATTTTTSTSTSTAHVDSQTLLTDIEETSPHEGVRVPASTADPTSRPRLLASLFDDLRARLDDSFAAEEYLQRRLTAHELLSLEERSLSRTPPAGVGEGEATPTPPARLPVGRNTARTPPPGRAALGAGGVRRLSSPAIYHGHRPTTTAATLDASSPTSPIPRFDFYPSPILERTTHTAITSAGAARDDVEDADDDGRRRALSPRRNQPIHSPKLLNAWSTRS